MDDLRPKVGGPSGRVRQALSGNLDFLLRTVNALASRLVSVGASVWLTFVLAQHLGPQGLGTYSVGYALAMGLATIARFGLAIGFVKWGAHLRARGSQRDLLDAFIHASTFCLVTGLLVSVIALMLLWLGARHGSPLTLDSASILPFVLATPACAVTYLFGAYCRVMDRPNLAPYFESAGVILLTLFGGWLAWQATGQVSLAVYGWSFLVSSLLVMALALGNFIWENRHTLPPLHRRHLRRPNPDDIWSHGMKDYAVIDLIAFSHQYGIVLIIGFFLSQAEVGLFSAAHRVASVLAFIVVIFNSITMADFSRLHATDDHVALRRLADKSTLFMVSTAAPMLIGLALWPGALLGLFGEAFQAPETRHVLLILLAGQTVNLLTGAAGPLLNMTGHQKVVKVAAIKSAIYAVLLLTGLTWQFGLIGAAIGASASLMIRGLQLYLQVRQTLSFLILPRL